MCAMIQSMVSESSTIPYALHRVCFGIQNKILTAGIQMLKHVFLPNCCVWIEFYNKCCLNEYESLNTIWMRVVWEIYYMCVLKMTNLLQILSSVL